jgi:hypothetical protein
MTNFYPTHPDILAIEETGEPPEVWVNHDYDSLPDDIINMKDDEAEDDRLFEN